MSRKESPAMKRTERRCILVVDDDKPILKTLSDFLIFKGFDVAAAESGEEALELIPVRPPDLILLDISMPGMGGIGFLKRILLSNDTLRYPVLVFTARTTTEDYFRGIPVDGFIAKPCDRVELECKVREILQKYKRASCRTILIGEDDARVADRLVEAFRTAGFEVEEAATGPEVIEKAAVCLPDAILLKQILPAMNGNAVASIMQAMPRTQSIPIVLYDASSLGTNEEEEERLRHVMGITRFLATENAGDLLNAVKEVLHAFGPSGKT
jgi:DNA-binding response OmpR family regulator